MNRTADLIKAAADALDDGRDPFQQAFLVDHDVTFDECMILSQLLAVGGRLVAFGIENPTVMLGALNGAQMAAAYQQLSAALHRVHTP